MSNCDTSGIKHLRHLSCTDEGLSPKRLFLYNFVHILKHSNYTIYLSVLTTNDQLPTNMFLP